MQEVIGSNPIFSTKPLKTRFKAGFGVSDSSIDSILELSEKKHPYVLAELFPKKPKPNARYYIKFSAWNEATDQLEEKIIWIPAKYKTDKEKRSFAATESAKINAALIAGKCFNATPTNKPKEESTKVLLLDAIQEQLHTKNSELRKKSGGTYSSAFNKFKEYAISKGLDKVPIKSFTKKDALGFRDYLIKTLENSNLTANNNKNYLCALFFMAKDRGYIQENPFSKVAPLPVTDSDSNIAFTPEHQTTLENWLRKNDPVLFLFTRFIYYEFIRPKELRQLKGSHIDLQRKTITIRGTIAKNKKTLTIPINKKLLEYIGTKVEKLPNKYLFGRLLVWLGDTPCSENYAYNRHLKALKETGLESYGYTLYSWKHTGCCRAIEAGVNPRKLQGLLRHMSLNETDIYLRSLGISLQNEELKEVW